MKLLRLWDRDLTDLVSVVRIIEVFFKENI